MIRIKILHSSCVAGLINLYCLAEKLVLSAVSHSIHKGTLTSSIVLIVYLV